MTDLVWKDPPTHWRGELREKIRQRLDAMEANPGKWLVWNVSPTSRAAQQTARHTRRRHPDLEVQCHGLEVFARIPVQQQEPK